MDASNRIDSAQTFSIELRKRRQSSAEDGQQDLFSQALGQQLAKNHDETTQRFAVGRSRMSDRAAAAQTAQPARDAQPAADAAPASSLSRETISGRRPGTPSQASTSKTAANGTKANSAKSTQAQTDNTAKPADDGSCAAGKASVATPNANGDQAKTADADTPAEDAAKGDDATPAAAAPTAAQPATVATPVATQAAVPVAQPTVLLLSGIPTPQDGATATANTPAGADPVALAALLGKMPATPGATPKPAATPTPQQDDPNALGDGTQQPAQTVGQAKPADTAPSDRVASTIAKPKAKTTTAQSAAARDAADAIAKPAMTQQASLTALAQTSTSARGISLPEGMGMHEDGEVGASDLEFSAWSEQIGPGLTPGSVRGANWQQSAFLAQLKQNIQMMPAHEQVAVQIQRAAQNGLGRLTVDLQPVELGRVEIKMSVDKDKNVTASVVVDRPATLDLLQRDARNLERILQDAGLQTDSGSLSFSLRNSGGDAQGQNQGGGTGTGNRGGADSGEAAATASAAARPTVVATADGLVDLET